MVRRITLCMTLSVCALISSLALRADVLFPTGAPDGRIALASRPASAGKMEIEAADDFITTTASTIIRATFTGLCPPVFRYRTSISSVLSSTGYFPRTR